MERQDVEMNVPAQMLSKQGKGMSLNGSLSGVATHQPITLDG